MNIFLTITVVSVLAIAAMYIIDRIAVRGVHGRFIKEEELNQFFKQNLEGYKLYKSSKGDKGHFSHALAPFISKTGQPFSRWYIYNIGVIPIKSKWNDILNERYEAQSIILDSTLEHETIKRYVDAQYDLFEVINKAINANYAVFLTNGQTNYAVVPSPEIEGWMDVYREGVIDSSYPDFDEFEKQEAFWSNLSDKGYYITEIKPYSTDLII